MREKIRPLLAGDTPRGVGDVIAAADASEAKLAGNVPRLGSRPAGIYSRMAT